MIGGMPKTVCILPNFPAGATGGVARHIEGLKKSISAYGWRVVPRPDEADLVHTHAVERTTVVDVYTNHGIHPLRPDMPAWQKQQNQAIFDNFKLARKVIAVSRWTASQWAGLTGLNPAIIPNGIDPGEWTPQAIQNLEWAHYQLRAGDAPVVLWGKTGLSDVCDPSPALELALRRPDIVVALTVEARLLPHAPNNVRLLGRLPFPQMQGVMAACDVYLATTLENHSIQVLEAMACGKPILGYAWGGTAETVVDRIHGRLVAPGDLDGLDEALDGCLAEAEHYGQMGKTYATTSFTLDEMARKTALVYEAAWAEKQAELLAPTCSIIIPVYNKAPFIAETIRSALAQRGAPSYEVIVVDDGSTDASLSEARVALGGATVPSQIITQENRGVAAARNTGIAASTGRYICCLDADDLLDPAFLARLSAALNADHGLGIAYSDMTAFGWDHQRGQWSNPLLMAEYDFEALKRGNFIPCCNLFRRRAWERAGGYRDINPSWEDYELWLRMGKLGWYGQRVPGQLFKYRKVDGQGRDHESHGHEWRLRAVVNRLHRDLYPPMLSVVIPCYQHSQFLPDAIRSALEQTYPDLEVVVVDDGNDDDEAQRIDEICADLGARLVGLEENLGLAEARNAGIEAARGTWILPLDADDKLSPVFVERAFRAIKFDPQLFAYSDSYLWWQNGEERLELLEAHEYDFEALLSKISWPCSIVYAKDAWRAVGGYKPEMSRAGGWEDWEFCLALGEIGVCGQRVPEPLFYYRQHGANQMRHTALANKPRLQETMRRLHAALYRGERPMGCCGGGRRPVAQPVVSNQAVQALATAANGGNVLVKYNGFAAGRRSWQTPSGARYSFSTFDNAHAMPAQDAAYFELLPEFQVIR